MLTFPSATHHVRHPPQGLGELQKSTFFFRGRNSTHWLSQISAHSSGAWRHSHLLDPFPIWGFILTSVNDASSPHARENLRSCLHLTNPCAKRKVLSLTKPKGKTYKTKSLGHYITSLPHDEAPDIYIYQTPPPGAGCDKKLIFK